VKSCGKRASRSGGSKGPDGITLEHDVEVHHIVQADAADAIDAFREKNGAASFREFDQKIRAYRKLPKGPLEMGLRRVLRRRPGSGFVISGLVRTLARY
jgi:hypothetical protein